MGCASSCAEDGQRLQVRVIDWINRLIQAYAENEALMIRNLANEHSYSWIIIINFDKDWRNKLSILRWKLELWLPLFRILNRLCNSTSRIIIIWYHRVRLKQISRKDLFPHWLALMDVDASTIIKELLLPIKIEWGQQCNRFYNNLHVADRRIASAEEIIPWYLTRFMYVNHYP